MTKIKSLFLFSIMLMCSVNAQQKNSFTLGLGNISTHNNKAQPAISLNGQFEAIIADSKEEMKLYFAVDFSTYIKEGGRVSSCSDCNNYKYSGFDMGARLSFELQETFVPIRFFTGYTRIITKGTPESNPPSTHPSSGWYGNRTSKHYLSNFFDLGIGIKAPISDRIFFSAEVLTGYSLESDSYAQQGLERYEFNMGVGIKF
ncbi:MAG: hypothetical protein JXR20_06170 [Balneola sp.]